IALMRAAPTCCMARFAMSRLSRNGMVKLLFRLVYQALFRKGRVLAANLVEARRLLSPAVEPEETRRPPRPGENSRVAREDELARIGQGPDAPARGMAGKSVSAGQDSTDLVLGGVMAGEKKAPGLREHI